jgi:hypothetical protein
MFIRPMLVLPLLGWTLCSGCRSEAEAPAKAEQTETKPAAAAPPAAQEKRIAGYAQGAKVWDAPKAEGPKWECDDLRYDFGSVYAGAIVRHPFIFRNAGSQELKVLKIKPRCSCSAAETYTRSLEPGKTGSIPFRLNTFGKEGFVDEWLDVETNDPVRPTMTVRLNGEIKSVCSLEVVSDAGAPAEADLKRIAKFRGAFGKIKPTDRLHRVLRMINKTPQPLSLTLQPIRPAGAPFSAELKEVQPGQEFELTIDGNPPFPGGSTIATVDFATNIPDQPFYSIRVSAYVPARIEVMPPKIVADANTYTIKKRRITITNNGASPFEVTKLAVSNPDFKLSMQPPDPANPNQTVIDVLLPPGEYRPPPYSDVIRIETTDAEKPVIELHVLPTMKNPPTPRPADKPLVFHDLPVSSE